jgi:hypothetical protein
MKGKYIKEIETIWSYNMNFIMLPDLAIRGALMVKFIGTICFIDEDADSEGRTRGTPATISHETAH